MYEGPGESMTARPFAFQVGIGEVISELNRCLYPSNEAAENPILNSRSAPIPNIFAKPANGIHVGRIQDLTFNLPWNRAFPVQYRHRFPKRQPQVLYQF